MKRSIEMAEGSAQRVRQVYGPHGGGGRRQRGRRSAVGPMMARLMRALHSPNWMINQDLCGGCRAVAEKMTGLDITGGEDIDNTACALIVGRNPAIADPIQWMALKRAKARGAQDPGHRSVPHVGRGDRRSVVAPPARHRWRDRSGDDQDG